MSQPIAKYVVCSGPERIAGVLWESDKIGKVFVIYDKLDPAYGLKVKDMDGQTVNEADLKEFLLSILPREEREG